MTSLPENRNEFEPALLDAAMHPTRRLILATAVGGIAYPIVGFAQAQVAPYQLLSLSTRDFPIQKVGSCADLERNITFIMAEAKRAKDNPVAVGKEFLAQVDAKRAEFKSAHNSALKLLDEGKIDLALSSAGLALSTLSIALGVAFTGPIAVGVLAGATVLAGPVMFAAQAYFAPNSVTPTFAGVFTAQRAGMFVELSAQHAGRKLLQHSVAALGLFVAAYEFKNTYADVTKAQTALKKAIVELGHIETALTAIGSDHKTWGELRHLQLVASANSLKGFVEASRSTNCLFVIDPPGPILRRP